MKNLLLLFATILLTSCSNTNETLMDDFVFMTGEQLTEKYGEPKRIDHSDEKSLTWSLEDDVKVKVFYLNSMHKDPEMIRFWNLNIDPDFFYNDFGWRMPEVSKDNLSGKMTYTGLQGIKTASYNPNLKTLEVELQSPHPDDFGKRY